MSLHQVPAIIQRVVSSIVMPSFRALRPEDIHAKDTPGDPEDLVTIVDHAAERALIEQLRDVVPGAVFIGEESASANPELMSALASPAPVWLIDPIDGTKNFARGHADFGVMLALVENGRTRASWMAVPAAQPNGYLVSADFGGGAKIDGAPITTSRRAAERPRGTVHTKMMPADNAGEVERKFRERYQVLPSTGSAATEYSAILRGDKDFVIYYRLLPWDHAPGTLAVTEAGGAAIHLSGEPYTPLSTNQVTILAATPELAQSIRRWLS